MNSRPAAELARAYEAVRAQATGQPAETGPRGLALILDAGLAAWITAWSSVAPAATITPARERSAVDPKSAELASVLTEMALASRQRCPA